ncbi:polysaccharide biosynthesis tyrosine autokinase [Kaistia geumhonensis]|uniref:non-specific protein-tyrosine kinase n=1 Tax=Kaistia geumhonensis TaxID=410839 RepID=A0ABU0M142_9HYPH|nr:polysaccharide biosynthesis tyrosine autokinase [Kaistia geumhonensis]MCX5480096.1 polysaccharide biosynthesis tyrosine autokinase [Kaistia geumhonensis]MDQ0514675.1 capsular exopolysaccharide synthesis family protein [Kaistia geumhonensis]
MSGDPKSENAVTTWSATATPARPSQAVSANLYGPPPVDSQVERISLDLTRLLRMVIKHRLVIGAIVAACIAIGLILTLTATPLYMASVTLETSGETVKVMEDQSLDGRAGGSDQTELATFVELIGSRSLAERVVDELKLADDPTFVSPVRRSLVDRFLSMLPFGGDDSAQALPIEYRKKVAVDTVLRNTSAKTVKQSRLLTISYSDADPRRAQTIANAVASGFIKANLDRRFDATTYARLFLEDQLAQVKQKLEDSERKVVAYADREKLVTLDDQKSILSQKLEDLNTALGKASIDRANAEQLWVQVKDATDYAQIPQGLEGGNNNSGSPSIINQLRASRSELVADYQSKQLTFKPGFPMMVALKARIDDVDKQIAEEVERTKTSIRSAYELAVQREQAISADLDETRAELIDTRNRSVEYTMLQREADTNRTLYDGLLQRYKEISVIGGVAANGLSIVDQASLPGAPYTPKLALNMALATFVGLLLGLGAAFGLEFFDNTIKTPDQMESILGIPVLGLIPVLPPDQPVQAVLEDPHSAVSEAYRSARTALQFSTDRGVPRNFMVTSARPSEGKTTTVTTLARMFGQIGMKILVIDADLRNPSLHKIVGVDNTAGLSNYLTGGADAESLLRDTSVANVSVLTSGPIPPNPAELLSGPRMLTLLTELRDQFDLVIVDSAPVMGLADALLLSSVADGTLIVCAAGETPIETIKAATKRLSMTNSQLLGGILTKFNSQKAGYGYAYYGYDYYGYGKDNQKSLPAA